MSVCFPGSENPRSKAGQGESQPISCIWFSRCARNKTSKTKIRLGKLMCNKRRKTGIIVHNNCPFTSSLSSGKHSFSVEGEGRQSRNAMKSEKYPPSLQKSTLEKQILFYWLIFSLISLVVS